MGGKGCTTAVLGAAAMTVGLGCVGAADCVMMVAPTWELPMFGARAMCEMTLAQDWSVKGSKFTLPSCVTYDCMKSLMILILASMLPWANPPRLVCCRRGIK